MRRNDVGTNTGEPENGSSDDKLKVLHIDDSPEFVEMASTFLRKNSEKLDIETRTDPTEVPGRLEEEEFDCVISDWQTGPTWIWTASSYTRRSVATTLTCLTYSSPELRGKSSPRKPSLTTRRHIWRRR
ncbi:MAG: response regulator [Halobacteriales archaeon]|nr:response regulator [Halobacteriales archaeon]